MKDLTFSASTLKGTVKVPPSKSLAHRAIICASLCCGKSRISGLQYSDDIKATIGVMRAVGADIELNADVAEIKGSAGVDCNAEAFCNESGSTLRMCLPVCAALNKGFTHFTGRGKLGARPMTVFEEIWKNAGLYYKDESAKTGSLDLTVKGALPAGSYRVRGDVSSQFISGLLFALPLADGDSVIELTTPLYSKGYVDLTLQALAEAGVDVSFDGEKNFYINGNQSYLPCDREVEGDWSQAAFFMVGNAIGSDIKINGLNVKSAQGDKVIKEYLERLKDEGELVFDGEDCPDIIPVFAVACALRKGITRLTGLSRLKIKECDRLEAVFTQLSAIGADVKREGDDLIFNGVNAFRGGVKVSAFNDHRIAMTLAIAATRCVEPITIDDFSCIAKSYPDFLDVYVELGGKVK